MTSDPRRARRLAVVGRARPSSPSRTRPSRCSRTPSARPAPQGWCARTPYGLAVLRYDEVNKLIKDRRLRQGSWAWPAHNGVSGPFAELVGRLAAQHGGRGPRPAAATAQPGVLAARARLAVAAVRRARARARGQVRADRRVRVRLAVRRAVRRPRDRHPARAPRGGLAAGRQPVGDDRPRDGRDVPGGAAADRGGPRPSCSPTATPSSPIGPRTRATTSPPPSSRRSATTRSCRPDRAAQLHGAHGLRRLRHDPQPAQPRDEDLRRPPRPVGAARAAKPELGKAAVEEVMRVAPDRHLGDSRGARRLRVRGLQIPAGHDHPPVLRVGRDRPAERSRARPSTSPCRGRQPHFGFGGGAHHCLGHFVGRMDMSVALPILAARMPDLRVGEGAEWLPLLRQHRPAPGCRCCSPRPPEPHAEPRGRLVKVIVDLALCQDHGQCAIAAPAVFQMDENSKLVFEGEAGRVAARAGRGRDGRLPRPGDLRRGLMPCARSVLVVGASLGGLRAAEQLRAQGFDGAIAIVGAEPSTRRTAARRCRRRPSPEVPATASPRSRASLAFRQRAERRGRRVACSASRWPPRRLAAPHGDAVRRCASRVRRAGRRHRAAAAPAAGDRAPVGRPATSCARSTTPRPCAPRCATAPARSSSAAGSSGARRRPRWRSLGCDVTVVEPLAVPMLRGVGPELGARAAAAPPDVRGSAS